MNLENGIDAKDRSGVHRKLLDEAMKQPGVKEVMEVHQASQEICNAMLGLQSAEEITVISASDSSVESL